MARVTITDEKLYSEIVEYCKENGLKVAEFCTDLLFGAFAVEKYGDTPFGVVKAEPVKPRVEPVVEVKEVEKAPTEPKVVINKPQEEYNEEPKIEEPIKEEQTVKPRKRRL